MGELSGLELRKAVAEKLGLRVHPIARALGGGMYSCTHQDCAGNAQASLDHPHIEVRAYEYDLNAVFKDVVPWANSHGWYIDIWQDTSYHQTKGLPYMVRFGAGCFTKHGISRNLAEAICRAALQLKVKNA